MFFKCAEGDQDATLDLTTTTRAENSTTASQGSQIGDRDFAQARRRVRHVVSQGPHRTTGYVPMASILD